MGRSLNDVSLGNGVLVASGSNGIGGNADKYQAMSHSVDGGESWTAVDIQEIGEFSRLQGAAYGNGRFVAVTSKGQVITSTDGKAWSLALDSETDIGYAINDFWRVTFGNGVFLIMGSHRTDIATWASADGLNWSEARPTGFGFVSTMTRLVFVNGAFYYVGDGIFGMSPGTGAAWSLLPISVGGQSVSVAGLAYGNGVYAAITGDGFLASSPDLTTWTVHQQLDNDTGALYGFSFVNGTFVLLMGAEIYTSTDGSTWTRSVVGIPGDMFDSVVYDGAKYVATGYPGLTAMGTVA
jgi:hypothetical protein